MADITIKRSWTDIASKLKGVIIGALVGGTGTVAGFDQVILWLWNGVFGFAGTGGQMSDAVAAVIGTILGGVIVGYFTPDKLPAGTTALTPTGVNAVISGDVKTPAAQKAGS
jgi:hypothetical protein